MKQIKKALPFLAAMITLSSTTFLPPTAEAGEITIPSQMSWVVDPKLAGRYVYTEDGEFSKKLNIPTYEWMCANGKPQAIVLGIHGLTLHGRRYRTLARTVAVEGYGFVSLDMRGFGRCRFDEENKFSSKQDNKKKINHKKSFEDVLRLAELINEKYPDVPIIALGESLGCTFCVKLAAERHDLVDGMILSGPAVKVNPAMYLSTKDIAAGVRAILRPGHKVNLKHFMTDLVAGRQEVVQEMLDDPLIPKELSLGELIDTDDFVGKTAKIGKNVAPELPVLILQGGEDRCVSPKAVTDLMASMPSCNQSLCWMGHFGHLQLETSYFRAKVLDAIASWVEDRTPKSLSELKDFEKNVNALGGILITDEHDTASKVP